jgi:hypothetical protein
MDGSFGETGAFPLPTSHCSSTPADGRNRTVAPSIFWRPIPHPKILSQRISPHSAFLLLPTYSLALPAFASSSLGFSPDARNRSDPSSLLPRRPAASAPRMTPSDVAFIHTPPSPAQHRIQCPKRTASCKLFIRQTQAAHARRQSSPRATGGTYRLRMPKPSLHAPPCCVLDTVLQVARHPAVLVAWDTGEIHRLAWRNSSLPEPRLR